MRYVAICLLVLSSLTPVSAQVKTAEEKKVATPAEIGGKSPERWIKELASKDPSKRDAAMRTIGMFGPYIVYEAVPVLIAELKKHSATSPIDLSVRISGTLALTAALAGVKDPDPKYVRDTVAILRGFLKDPQAVVKTRALEALPQLGPEALAALPEVILLVRDKDTWETRQTAVQTLGVLVDSKQLGDGKVLAALYKALEDSATQVRLAALQTLARLGPGADPVHKTAMIREIEEAAKGPDPSVQIVSHLALMTVKQLITNDQLVAIAKMLKHADAGIRTQAAQALGLAGPKGKAVAPSLMPLLDDRDAGVVTTAMSSLVRMEHAPAMPAIGKLLKHPNDLVRIEAAKTIGGAGTLGRPEAPLLIDALGDPNPAVVASCIVALARLEYAGAVPALQKLAAEPMQSEEMKKAAKDAVDLIQKADKKK